MSFFEVGLFNLNHAIQKEFLKISEFEYSQDYCFVCSAQFLVNNFGKQILLQSKALL